jgi:hypothetical protein
VLDDVAGDFLGQREWETHKGTSENYFSELS